MSFCRPETAIDWASERFASTDVKIVTDHAWGKTFRLLGSDGSAFLKLLPQGLAGQGGKQTAISLAFAGRVPKLVDFDPQQNLLLFEDHEAKPIFSSYDPSLRSDVLRLYGGMQAEIVHDLAFKQYLPGFDVMSSLTKFCQFFDISATTPGLDGSMRARDFFGAESATQYQTIFERAEPLFAKLLAGAVQSKTTINHCDLRVKNIARRGDGSLVIFDWDESVIGPPGLSLHAVFSGATRPVLALGNYAHPKFKAQDRDKAVLQTYVQSLSKDSVFSPEVLRHTLPGAIVAGTMNYVASFGDHPLESRDSIRAVARNIRKRLSDLMNVAELLAIKYPDNSEGLMAAFDKTGRQKRAERILASLRQGEAQDAGAKPAALSHAELWSEAPVSASLSDAEVFPAIQVQPREQAAGQLDPARIVAGVDLFRENGALMIADAIPVASLETCRHAFMANMQAYQADIDNEAALRVGDKRYMVTPQIEGPLANEAILASPFVLPIVQALLGNQAILGSVTSVVSMPGSKKQSLHRDNNALFKEESGLDLPSFSIALIIPLVPLNRVNGATRIIKGSHRANSSVNPDGEFQEPLVPLGSCYLMDCRLQHQGMANNSSEPRPILSMVYQRSWYRDYQNFRQQDPVRITVETFARLSAETQNLLKWAL